MYNERDGGQVMKMGQRRIYLVLGVISEDNVRHFALHLLLPQLTLLRLSRETTNVMKSLTNDHNNMSTSGEGRVR